MILMKAKNREINEIRPKIVKILKKRKVKKAGIFGSYARGEQKRGSDIDIIIQPPPKTGFGFAGIKSELEKGIGKKVDLITYKSIDPLLREKILNEEIRLI